MHADAAGEPAHARLAIVIPAFGRAEAIATSISAMADEARAAKLDIAFYVSDDTTDDTVENAIGQIVGVHYRRNRPALGHDCNIIASLLWPNADYVWPIGSNYRAAGGKLAAILNFLHSQDLVFVNNHAGQRPRVEQATGKEAGRLLKEMIWHQTLTGTTIYSRKVSDWIEGNRKTMRLVSNFPQICTILGYAADNSPSIGWFEQSALQTSDSGSTSYWRTKAIDVFARDWCAAIAAFPSVIEPHKRRRVVREHSARTDLFNTSNLISLREGSQFNWSAFTDANVRHAMHLPLWKLLLILTLPISLLRYGSRGLAKAKLIFGITNNQVGE